MARRTVIYPCSPNSHEKLSRLENKSQDEKRLSSGTRLELQTLLPRETLRVSADFGSKHFAAFTEEPIKKEGEELEVDDALVKEGGVSYLLLPVGPRDHVQGSGEAAVTLLEYGDFECGHCAEAFPMVKEITRWLRGELRYAFRHFPDVEKHQYALRAAEAVEAAGTQGRFWEMHDLLYEHSPALDAVHLKLYAQQLELDLKRFEREMRENVYLKRVREDFESGIASGVGDTLAFFINGVRYRGEVDLDSLLAAIEEAGNQALCSGS